MVQAVRITPALAALMILGTLAPASVAASAARSEMEIVDLYLEQFDTWRGADEYWTTLVLDRCLRTGGNEELAKLPPAASVDATNDLMFQHARWHGEHGRLLEPIFTWSDSDLYGIEFLEYHRDLVATFQDWRVAHGFEELVAWDPMTPIPEAFAYPVDVPCRARESENPGVPLPSFLTVSGGNETSPFWGYTALCQIPDANRLGKTIEGSWYHADVHLAIGGDMADAGLTLRDPIFWPWHVHVQDIYESWLACASLPLDEADHPEAKEAPGPMLPVLFLVLVWVARRSNQA